MSTSRARRQASVQVVLQPDPSPHYINDLCICQHTYNPDLQIPVLESPDSMNYAVAQQISSVPSVSRETLSSERVFIFVQFKMTNDTCPWPLYDEKERNNVADQLHFLGGFSSVMFIGLLLAYIHPNFKTNRSYQNIGFFMLSAWLRRVTPFLMSYFIDGKEAYRRDMTSCRLFGFLETFMAIHEVECLTHICIERYVVAKYITNGWRIPIRHYYMFRLLSVMFAGAYSLAALSGLVGGYGYDFTCLSCTMDMVLPDGWQKYAVTMLFVLRSIKPVGFMLVMLRWAKQFEGKFKDVAYNHMQKKITDDVIILTAVNLICWAPIFLIRTCVIMSQHNIYGHGAISLPSPSLVKMALLLHWNSLSCSTITLFLLNPNIRTAALSFRFRLPPELASDTHKKD